MPEDKPIDETKKTVEETKEPITAVEENKAVEKEETKVEETKTLLTTGTLLMPEETMINSLGEIITFTVSDPLVGSQVSIKRTVNEK